MKSTDPNSCIILYIVIDALTVIDMQLHIGLAWNRVYSSANQ